MSLGTGYKPGATKEDTANFVGDRDLSDDALVGRCRFEAFTASGPGGTRRNRTRAAIRLIHVPTGLTVIAGEARSQQENRGRALKRMRLKLAIELRRVIDPRGWEPPAWFMTLRGSGTRLAVAARNPLYPQVAGLVLDLLLAREGHIGDVAGLLGVSTSSVVRFLYDEPQLWIASNKIVTGAGKPPLRAPSR